MSDSKVASFSETALSTAIEAEIDDLAGVGSLAVVVLDENYNVVSSSNDNSICQSLYRHGKFEGECAAYCGSLFSNTDRSGTIFPYKCFAGLHCRAVSFRSGEQPLVAIVGRVFLDTANYREARIRAIEGEWKQLAAEELFANILITNSTTTMDLMVSRAALIKDETNTAVVPKPTGFPPGDVQAAPIGTNPSLGPIESDAKVDPTGLVACENCGKFNLVETIVCTCGYWAEKNMVLPGPSDIDFLNSERRKKKIIKLLIGFVAVMILLAAAYWAGFSQLEF